MIHITVEGRGSQPRTIHSGTPLCAAERSNNTHRLGGMVSEGKEHRWLERHQVLVLPEVSDGGRAG